MKIAFVDLRTVPTSGALVLPLHGALPNLEYVKEELVELWKSLIAKHAIPVRTGVRLKGVADAQAQQNVLFQGDIKSLLDDRLEFKDLWAAQKRESVALDNLRQNQGDPEIQALLSMKGLDVMVSRTEIAKLQGDKDALKQAKLSIEEFNKQFASADETYTKFLRLLSAQMKK